MLPRLIILSLLIYGNALLAQSAKQDFITYHYDSHSKIKLNKIDSSNDKVNDKIDATQSKINKFVNPNFNPLITKEKVEKKKRSRDSIQFTKKQEAQKKVVQNKIDSLVKIQQPPGRYAWQLDSLHPSILSEV